MLLVLDRACAHGNIAQQVNEVLVVRRIEHLVGGKEAGLLDYAQVHVADGLNAFEQVVGGLGVGVVQQALVAGALGARLVGVDARNDDELVLDLFGDLGQAVHVLEDRVLAVGRARADDEHLARVLPGKDLGDLGVECLLFGGKLGGKWHFLADFHGDRQPAFKIHGHAGPPQSNKTKCELPNARHYPLSHAKVQALVTTKPAKKGQVYFGRFYLGKRQLVLEWNDATWLGRGRRSSFRGGSSRAAEQKRGRRLSCAPVLGRYPFPAAESTPPRRTASCTGRRRSRPGRAAHRACPSRRCRRRGSPRSRRRCGSWTGGAR